MIVLESIFLLKVNNNSEIYSVKIIAMLTISENDEIGKIIKRTIEFQKDITNVFEIAEEEKKIHERDVMIFDKILNRYNYDIELYLHMQQNNTANYKKYLAKRADNIKNTLNVIDKILMKRSNNQSIFKKSVLS